MKPRTSTLAAAMMANEGALMGAYNEASQMELEQWQGTRTGRFVNKQPEPQELPNPRRVAKAKDFAAAYGGSPSAFATGGLHINYQELHRRLAIVHKVKDGGKLTRKERRLLAQVKRQRK